MSLAARLAEIAKQHPLAAPQFQFTPLPEWLPDLPAHRNPGLVTCKNAIPRTPESYGPFPTFSAYGSALGARCQGAFLAHDTAGNVNLFAGDAGNLYRLTSAGTTWENVTRGGGAPVYITGSEDRWGFLQFGLRIIAFNGHADEVQTYVIGGAAVDFAQLASGAPRARYGAVVREFIMFANTFDGVDGSQSQRVWWSEIGVPTSFPALGSSAAAAAQSDKRDLPGMGQCQGIIGGLAGADVVIVLERGLARAGFVGSPKVFDFQRMEGARGSPAPGSIVQSGSVFAYLGEDGFYLSDGASSTPIGANKIDKTFFIDLDQGNLHRMWATPDVANKAFLWLYPGAGNSGGTPNRILVYQWELRRWSLIELTAGAETIFGAAAFGFNLDNAGGLGYNVDNSPYGPDSRFWTGGRPSLAIFDTAHKLAFIGGANLKATFETGDLDLLQGQRARVTGIRPVADGGALTVALGYRNDQASMVQFDTATAPGADAFCPANRSARYQRARLDIAAGGTWTHARGLEFRYQPDGWQ